ncbi:Helicase associated domain protein [Streptomyces sp. CA-243310]|uniref:helicase associated domain-containing protein n=1 Tax=Streptomyces sp. CA-243310 TaxID=3240056 RepID=UPI003D8C916B
MSTSRARTSSAQDCEARAAETVVNALLAGSTLKQAARTARVTVAWIQDRFQRDQKFRHAVDEAAALHPDLPLFEALVTSDTVPAPSQERLPRQAARETTSRPASITPRRAMMSRPHQRDAIAAVTSHLTPNRRATLVAACGTGKTYIAARVAEKIAPRGRTLVLVPTLDLLAQTVETWQAAGREGVAIAVCSAEEVMEHRGGDVTSSPSQLAALSRNGAPVSVYATYASLPVLTAAHRDHALPAWDLAIIDEAHRTAGALGKAWAAIHHDEVIPARRRLYQTATPRVWAGNASDSTPLATMDDHRIFGQVAYRLGFGEAIERGLLADYNVLVPVVTDADLADTLTTGRAPGDKQTRNAALQTAIVRAIKQTGVRRVISYHHRVASARALTDTFAETARAATGAPPLPPVLARTITGSHSLRTRDRLLREFTEHDGVALIANARVFSEGIDIDGIDGIVFADARGSSIDAVQAIGRALRQKPGAPKKTASIIVPVYTGTDEDPELILESSAYAPLWLTLRALRAHDDRFTERVEILTATEREDSTRAAPATPWLRSLGEHAPDLPRLALAIDLRVLSPKSAEWRLGYTAAKAYHRKHRHLDAPQAYVTSRTGFALGRWLSWQRHLYRAGQLSDQRAAALDALGMIWSPRADQWQRSYVHAKAYATKHGHLAVPVSHEVDGFKLGVWIVNLRERIDQITPQNRALLDALDPDWAAPWPLAWRRGYQAARAHQAAHGSLTGVLRTHKTESGLMLGEWLLAQARTRQKLTPEQIQRLDDIGIDWNPPSPHEVAWHKGLAAARAYLAEFGNLEVPQSYCDRQGFKLGTWINNQRQRRRRDGLSPERVQILNTLMMRW